MAPPRRQIPLLDDGPVLAAAYESASSIADLAPRGLRAFGAEVRPCEPGVASVRVSLTGPEAEPAES